MKLNNLLLCFLGLSLMVKAAPPAPAPALDKSLEIVANRKQASTSTRTIKEAGSPTARKIDLIYDITVNNTSLKDEAPVEVKYIIFLSREKLGDKKEGMERLKGKGSINALKSREKQTIETEDFSLSEQKLSPDWYYANGGKTQTRETVKGIWVRLYRDGVLVNELSSPAGLTAKEEWRD